MDLWSFVSSSLWRGLMLAWLGGLFILALPNLGAQPPSAKQPEQALLWEIRRPDSSGPPSYLFGTMHVRDERVFHLPDSVLPALTACRQFALEQHPDTLLNLLFSPMMQQEPGQPDWDWQQALPPTAYQQLAAVIRTRTRLPARYIRHLPPWLLNALLQDLDLTRTQHPRPVPLDAWCYSRARAEGMAIRGLEHPDDLPEIYATFSRPQVLDFIRGHLEQILHQLEHPRRASHPEKGYAQLLRQYLNQDLEGLYRIWRTEVSNPITRRLLQERNTRMAARLQALIRLAPTFAVAGAMHLPGPEGLLAQLQDKGYLVRPIYSVRSKRPVPAVVTPVSSVSGTEFDIPGTAARITFPGPPVTLDFDSRQQAFPIYLYRDYGTGYLFLLLKRPLQARLTEDQARKVMQHLAVRMLDVDTSAVLDWKPVLTRGARAWELTAPGARDQQLRLRMVSTDRELFVLLAQASDAHGDLHAPVPDRFFTSLILPDRLEANAAYLYTSETGAFSQRFPGPPEATRATLRPPRPELPTTWLYEYRYTTPADGLEWRVFHYDLEPGRYIERDTVYLRETLRNYAGEQQGDLRLETYRTRDGFPSLAFSLRNEAGARQVGRAILRGPRTYIQLLGLPPGSGVTDREATRLWERYAGTLTFLPYPEHKSWTAFTPTDNAFRVRLPRQPELTVPLAQMGLPESPGGVGGRAFLTREPISGVGFNLYEYRFPPWYQTGNLDTLLTEMRDSWLVPGDSVLVQTRQSQFGCRGLQCVVRRAHAHTDFRMQYLVSGRAVYLQVVCAPSAYLQSQETDFFFSSLHPDARRFPGRLTDDRARKLLQDLRAPDTTTRYAARSALLKYGLSVDRIGLESVYRALEESWPDDWPHGGDETRNGLLAVVDAAEDAGTVRFLEQYYQNQAAAHPRRQFRALQSLARLGTRAALITFTELLTEAPPEPPSDASLAFEPFYADVARVLPYLERLIPRLADPGYAVLNDLLAHGLESGQLEAADLEPMRAAWQAGMKPVVALSSTPVDRPETGVLRREQLLAYVRLLDFFPKAPETGAQLRTLVDRASPQVAYAALCTLLRHRLPVEEAWIERFAVDPAYAAAFFAFLTREHLARRFPDKARDQAFLAESQFRRAMSQREGITLDRIRVWERFVIGRPGQKEVYYLFRFRADRPDDRTWYVGLSGPHPAGSSGINVENARNTTRWLEEDTQSAQQHFEGFLQSE